MESENAAITQNKVTIKELTEKIAELERQNARLEEQMRGSQSREQAERDP